MTNKHMMLVDLINSNLSKEDLVSNDLVDFMDYEENAYSALMVATTLIEDLVPSDIYTHDGMGEVIFA